MKDKSESARSRLLAAGMGLYVLAAALTAANCILLPFARACYRVPLLTESAAFAAAAAAAFALGRISRGRESRLFSALAPCWLALFFAASALIGWAMEYTPAGDNMMLYSGSEMLARDGSFAANPDFGLYFARFPHQWGTLWMMTLIRRLLSAFGIGRPFAAFAVLQAACHALGYGALLYAVRRAHGCRTALRLLFAIALFPPVYLAPGNLYTDTFSLPFAALSFAMALRAFAAEEEGGRWLPAAFLSGLAAAAGAQIKTIVLIVPVACVLTALLRMPLRRAAAFLALSALPAALLSCGVRAATLGRAVDPAVYAQQKTPLLHWVVMSIPSPDNPHGGYRWADYDETWRLTDGGASRGELTASLLRRMKDKVYTLRYPSRLLTAIARKNASMAGDGTFGMTEMLDDRPVRRNALSEWVLSDGAHYRLYRAVMAGLWMFHLARAAACGAAALRMRRWAHAPAMIALFGAMLFLMGWEVHSRYLFCFLPLFMTLSAAFRETRDEARG